MHRGASSSGITIANPDSHHADGSAEGELGKLALPGGYELIRRLGTGGFGTVYEARQLSTGQRVAIKVLHPGGDALQAQDEGARERFRREMQLCGGLSHPNIVRLIDSGETDAGLLYAVFEFVPGTTLREVLEREGRLDVFEAIHLMAQVLDALSSAHALGIVHRDLKPENVMISRTGVRRNALVLDFGLGGLLRRDDESADDETEGGGFVGTPAYAAPEQIHGEPPSTRSDLYAWGLLFIECLTGEPAMGRGSPAEIMHRQLDASAVPIPEAVRGLPLGRLLQVVTAKRVVERDATAEGLLHALDRLDRQVPVSPSEPVAIPGDGVSGERRQVTIVSCRLTVEPALVAPDLEEVDHLLHAQHATISEIAAQHGGRLASAIADRVVLLFGYTQASEDSARRAVRAALDVVASVARTNQRGVEHRIPLDVRVGIHTGLVVAREHRQSAALDLVGVTPQTAAAIEARAPSGAILLSAATRALLREGFAVEPAGPLRTSESDAPIELFRVDGASSDSVVPRGRVQTPLVGRRREVEALTEAWRKAGEGSPGTVLLLGEAGVGKSRLLQELRRAVPAEAWLACRCTPENRTSPLRPFVDLLGAVREPLGDLLARNGLEVATVLPLFEALLGRAATDSRDETMTPERQKELTLEALVRLLLKMSEGAPVVLAIEDLHWADATTVELVTRIVHEVNAAAGRASGPRLLAVMTGRPEFSPGWSPVPGSLLVLPRFAAEEVREMIAACATAGSTPSEELLARIVERCDGIPLFVEEVTRLVVDAAATGAENATANGAEARSGSVVPGTLRDLLTARLDTVRDAARETAQLAAVLGREFRYEVLRAVSSRAELELREELSDLAAAGLVFRQHRAQSESWFFKHALLRDAAYESIVRPARRRLHQRVVRTLRERFPDFARRRPDALALHHEGAGEVELAIESWQLAADAALRKAAFVESQQQAEHAIGLLEQVEEVKRRDRLRLDLLTTLGTAQFNLLGLSAAPVEETFRQAEEIAERIDSEISLMVLNGMWSVQFARGNRDGISRLLPFMHRLAESEDPMSALTGNTGVGIHAFWNGEFEKGRSFAARARGYYGHPEVRSFVKNLGWDGTMYCYSVEFLCLWHLGFPDEARALCQEMMEKVAVERNPTAIAPALGFEAMLLRDLGDHEAAIRSADRLIAMATEQKLYLWMAIGFLCRASGMIGGGDGPGALMMLQQGLMILKTIGTMLSYAYYQVDLAQAQILVGDLAGAEAAIAEGLQLCETTFARFFEPELHRLRGIVLVRQGDLAGAKASVLRAIARARELGARSYELRATATMAEVSG